ncbi:MAG: hypothetical protein HC777_03290 [Hyphomonadaceae bacterium]|nr:hypothetical protein [Hyphomonadaceae bacterium]
MNARASNRRGAPLNYVFDLMLVGYGWLRGDYVFGKRKRDIEIKSASAPNFEGNGPDTPVIDVSAMRRALDHAAWRAPQE